MQPVLDLAHFRAEAQHYAEFFLADLEHTGEAP